MARVNVEQKALSDRRFHTLGRLTGESRHAALGRMILVWNECQERETYILTSIELDDINPDAAAFSVAVVESGLARHEGGGIYICGTRGRIEWLAARRKDGKNARGGGRPKTLPDDSAETPKGLPGETPPAPAPAPAPAGSKVLSPEKEDQGSKTFKRAPAREKQKSGNGHGGKGDDGISEGQFAFIATLVKKWNDETRELRVGSSGAAYERDFNRQNFGISLKRFEQLRRKFVDSS
jgi:hypothetical protein